jgi:hypothetical protein
MGGKKEQQSCSYDLKIEAAGFYRKLVPLYDITPHIPKNHNLKF